MSLKKVKIESQPQSVQQKIKQLDEEHRERLQIFQRENPYYRQTNHEYRIPYDPPNFRYDYSQYIGYYDFSLVNSKFDISLDYFNQIQRFQISEETVGVHKSANKNFILEVDQEQLNQRLPPREKDSLDTQFALRSSVRKSDTNNLSIMETKQREQSNQKCILGDNYVEQIYFQRRSNSVLNVSTYDLDRELSEILIDQLKKQQIISSPQPILQQQYLQQYEEFELVSDEEVEYVERANKKEIVQQFLNRKSSFLKQQSSQNSKQSQDSKQSQSINNPIVDINNLLLSNSGKEEQSDQKSIHSLKSIRSQKQIEQEIFRPAQSEQGRQQEQQQLLEQQSKQKQISNFQSNMKQSIHEIASNQSEKSIFDDLISPQQTHSKSMIQNHNASERNYQRVIQSEKQIGHLQVNQLRSSTTQSIQLSLQSLITQQQIQKPIFPNIPFTEQLEEFKRQSESHLKIQQTPRNNDPQIKIMGEFPTMPFNQQLEEFKKQSKSHQQTPGSVQALIIKSSSSSSSSNIQSRRSVRQSGQFVTVGDKEIQEIEYKLRWNSKFSFENLSVVDFQLDLNQPLRIKNQKQYLQFVIDAKIAHDKIQNEIKESLLGQKLIDKVKADTNEKIFQQKLSIAQKKLLTHTKGTVTNIKEFPDEQIQNSDSSIISINQNIPSISSSQESGNPPQVDQNIMAAFEEVIRRPNAVQGFAGKKKPIKRKGPAKKKVWAAKQPFQQKVTKNKRADETGSKVESNGHIGSFVIETSCVVEHSVSSKRSFREIRPYTDFQNEESNEESNFAQRAPQVFEIPKFNPYWNKEKERNIARLRNDYMRTEDWRKVTDIMPRFYPAETEAGGFKLTVLEGTRDFRFILQFTLYSGQVIGPVMCQKRMSLLLGRKPEPYQTEEMLQGLSLYSKVPLNRGFCERKECFVVQKKFILANGTRMDIRFQMVYDPAIQIKRTGRRRQLR